MRTTVTLQTPPAPLWAPKGVFDGFAWCESDTLVWSRPASRPFDLTTPVDGTDPARMVFVFHEPVDWLPRELAQLHAFGMGLNDEWALAPYAIDDATDELFARKVRPRSLLWLAADNLNALFWGLHDWSHFHNHGPFEERAFTELQCDLSALFWIWSNRGAIGLDDRGWLHLHGEVTQLILGRLSAEGKDADEALRRRISATAVGLWR